MINFLFSKKKCISKETKKLTQQNNKLKIFISEKKDFNTLLKKKNHIFNCDKRLKKHISEIFMNISGVLSKIHIKNKKNNQEINKII